jgi:hypothetical protein
MKNYFRELLNYNSDNDVRQTETHIQEPLVPEPNSLQVQFPTKKLKRYKSPGTDQIPTKLIQAGGGNALSFESHKFINSIWNKKTVIAIEGIYFCTCLQKEV